MAIDIFLTIPGIPGESTSDRFKDAIQIDSFSWGLASQDATGGGSGAGKVQLSDFHFTKKFDKASPKLMQALATGAQLPGALVSLVNVGKVSHAFLTYDFREVLVTSVADSGADDIPTESISFNMAKVTVTYYPQTSTGAFGSPVIFGYDIGT